MKYQDLQDLLVLDKGVEQRIEALERAMEEVIETEWELCWYLTCGRFRWFYEGKCEKCGVNK